MVSKEYKYDVFISYSTVDQKVAEGLCGYLEQGYQYRCFVAYRDIPPGKVWASALAEAIDSSAVMVVVFSESFNVSPQTDREIELASENKTPILTFKLSNASMTGAKKYYLKNLNWIDAFPYPETYFGKLKDSVDKLLSRDSKRERRLAEESERLRREREEKERMIREDEERKRGESVELLIKDRGMAPMAKSMDHENVSNLPYVFFVGGVEFKMVWEEGDSYTMRKSDGQGDNSFDMENLKDGYYISESEVSPLLWEAVMGSDKSYKNSKWKRLIKNAAIKFPPLKDVAKKTAPLLVVGAVPMAAPYLIRDAVVYSAAKRLFNISKKKDNILEEDESSKSLGNNKDDDSQKEAMSWDNVQEFVCKLNSLTGKTFSYCVVDIDDKGNKGFRLLLYQE